jgi:hypothetical protein
MPTARLLCQAFNRVGVYVGLRACANIELHNGTTNALCRVASTCKIETYLGNFADGMEIANLLQEVAFEVRGDVGKVIKVCSSKCSGRYPEAESSECANWVYEAYQRRISLGRANIGPTLYKGSQLIRKSHMRYGKTYLATI